MAAPKVLSPNTAKFYKIVMYLNSHIRLRFLYGYYTQLIQKYLSYYQLFRSLIKLASNNTFNPLNLKKYDTNLHRIDWRYKIKKEVL